MLIPQLLPASEITDLLNATKKNYNLTNKKIAEGSNFSEATISRWCSSKVQQITIDHRQLIIPYLQSIWKHGLICCSPFDKYTSPIFYCVEDIKNPFHTWAGLNTYEDNEDQQLVLQKCEKAVKYKKSQVYLVQEFTTLEEIYHNHYGLILESSYTFGHAFQNVSNQKFLRPGPGGKVIEVKPNVFDISTATPLY